VNLLPPPVRSSTGAPPVQLGEPCDKTEANADPGGVGAHLLAPLECFEDRFFEVSEIPGPSSSTRLTTSSGRGSSSILIEASSGEYLAALEIKFSTILSTLGGSRSTTTEGRCA
jgi:hypothetical protein